MPRSTLQDHRYSETPGPNTAAAVTEQTRSRIISFGGGEIRGKSLPAAIAEGGTLVHLAIDSS